ncbi:exported hypothetical protein [uncultured Desulfovibrio sp.]|uniref:Uncharacterized protein n=1 Tax=uncultured Desulfovibrio sp. TaxID=167968 RepID=A0A212L8J7_9BACT|nr:exported hypothetical protein [uncultured Desulfovibrio sp.]VZH34457.1 conserved exported protein of unknown function [Desulfovibrio sp. 86]
MSCLLCAFPRGSSISVSLNALAAPSVPARVRAKNRQRVLTSLRENVDAGRRREKARQSAPERFWP